jgi:hypothetical protein
VGASTAIDGLGEAVVAYGYVMTGTTLAACTLANPVVTTTLYTSTTKVFSGARYGKVSAIHSAQANYPTASTVTSSYLTTAEAVGSNSLYTKVATV